MIGQNEYYALLNLQLAFENQPFDIEVKEIDDHIRTTISLCGHTIAELWLLKEYEHLNEERLRRWIAREINYAKKRESIIEKWKSIA